MTSTPPDAWDDPVEDLLLLQQALFPDCTIRPDKVPGQSIVAYHEHRAELRSCDRFLESPRSGDARRRGGRLGMPRCGNRGPAADRFGHHIAGASFQLRLCFLVQLVVALETFDERKEMIVHCRLHLPLLVTLLSPIP